MRIDPLLTVSPVTGALRHVTDSLLAETYLAPFAAETPLPEILAGRHGPWSASFSVAPDETETAVAGGLDMVMRATRLWFRLGKLLLLSGEATAPCLKLE